MGNRIPLHQYGDRSPRLLCVDDNARFLEAFASLLQLCGYAVVTSDDPRAAVLMASSSDLDLAIVDYDMPYMSGFELATELKRIKPGLPVVLFSGNPDLSGQDLQTVDEYIAKGSSVQFLLSRLDALVGECGHSTRRTTSRAEVLQSDACGTPAKAYVEALPPSLADSCQARSAAATNSGD